MAHQTKELKTVQINVHVDTSRLIDTAKRYPRNLAFSTAQALNDTAKDAQTAIRQHMARVFRIRTASSRGFLDRSIKIMQFASVSSSRPYALIGVDETKARSLLSLFEEGGDRLPFVGRREAVPRIATTGARRTFESKIDRNLLITSLGMHRGPTASRKTLSSDPRNVRRRKGSPGNYTFWQGNQDTFMLEHSRRAPYGGIFQRVGKGKGDGAIAMLYSFRPSVRLRAVLSFVAITGATFDARFQANLERRFFHLRGIGG